MKNYKHLKLIENDYHIKPRFALAHVFLILALIVGFALALFTDYTKVGWGIVGFIAFCAVLSQTTHKGTQKIVMENGAAKLIELQFAKFRAPTMYSVSDIRSFTVHKTYLTRIRISNELYAELDIDGQHKRIALLSSMSLQDIQELYNELEDLLSMKSSSE